MTDVEVWQEVLEVEVLHGRVPPFFEFVCFDGEGKQVVEEYDELDSEDEFCCLPPGHENECHIIDIDMLNRRPQTYVNDQASQFTRDMFVRFETNLMADFYDRPVWPEWKWPPG